MPSPIDELAPEMVRLIESTETALDFITKQEMSREAAIEIRGRFARSLGALANKHHLRPEPGQPSESLVTQMARERVDRKLAEV